MYNENDNVENILIQLLFIIIIYVLLHVCSSIIFLHIEKIYNVFLISYIFCMYVYTYRQHIFYILPLITTKLHRSSGHFGIIWKV